MIRIALILTGGVVLVTVVGLYLAARLVRPPQTLGVNHGRLAPCPPTPNCVSSQSTDPATRMDPIPYGKTLHQAQERLLRVIAAWKRATIVTQRDGYVHVEVRSALFGFVDDVEFAFDQADGVIHFRSAARLGRRDFGVNRRRMAELRAALVGAQGGGA